MYLSFECDERPATSAQYCQAVFHHTSTPNEASTKWREGIRQDCDGTLQVSTGSMSSSFVYSHAANIVPNAVVLRL